MLGSTIVNYGTGGGIDSEDTTRAKQFILKFLKHIRQVINNVDINIKVEHPVPCPPEYRDDPAKPYQVDVAVLFPSFKKYDLGIEIDGYKGHKHPDRDALRDKWIYVNHQLPILRLDLSWIKDWMRRRNYLSMLEELMYRHKAFTFAKLPKSPILHLAYKNRGELFGS